MLYREIDSLKNAGNFCILNETTNWEDSEGETRATGKEL